MPFMFLLSLVLFLTCIHIHNRTHSRIQRYIHMQRTRKRVALETEAWVKEGCWQRKGLTHLLATKSLSPPSNALKGTVQQCRAKHSGRSLDPCTCLHWRKVDRPRICASVGVCICVKVAGNLSRGIRFSFFFPKTKMGRENRNPSVLKVPLPLD